MMHSDCKCDNIATIERDLGRRFFRRWSALLETWRRRAAMRAKLESFNDHILRDIGFSRDSIATEVWRQTRFPHGPNFR